MFRFRPAFLALAVSALAVSTSAWAEDSAPRPNRACAADIKQVCSGIQPGGGRIVACLNQNADKVSQPCKDAMAKAKTARQNKSSAPQAQ